MQSLFQEAVHLFKTDQSNMINLLKPFSSVVMADSSGISLPYSLKPVYKGSGGSASEAGLKIQVLFDYLQGQMKQLTVTEGVRNDQSFDGHLSQIEPGSLHLQDLGYFKLTSFQAIQAKGAHFISRYLQGTSLLDEANKEIDLLSELRKTGPAFSKEVRLGKKEKIAVRLIASRLPEDEVEKRLRKIHRTGQKRGKTPAKEKLELAQWSIYITNVPENVLNDEQIHLVYTLRWQIELFFKLCKSEAGIAKVSGKKIDRVLCEIYAKLICVVMLLYFCFPLRWQDNREVSFYKAYAVLKLNASRFLEALKSPCRLLNLMRDFMSDINDFGLKDKCRKKRPPTYQKLIDSTGQKVFCMKKCA